MRVGQTNTYSKTKVDQNKYIQIEVQETVTLVTDVINFPEPVAANVLQARKFGKIKFVLHGVEYISDNPYFNYIDKRSRSVLYAIHQDNDNFIVINLNNVAFDMSAVAMSKLHDIKFENEEWLDIPGYIFGRM